jgi:hypothetical protein
MKAVVRIALMLVALVPAVAFAQEPQAPAHPLAGFWKGTITAEGAEPFEFTVQFRIQGDVVTGPILSKAGEVYLQDGSVTANSVTFTTARPDLKEGGPLAWTGQLTGDNTLDVMVAPKDNSTPAIEVILTKADQ